MAIGYRIAWVVEDAMVILAMIPVTLIVIGGTYFLFTQFSILLANKIRGSRRAVYNKTKLISYSQLIFKLKDTAKVMFLASILIAVSFSATETIYSFYKDSGEVMGFETVEDIGIVYRGKDGFEGEYEEAKKDMLAYKDKIGMEKEAEFIVVANKDSEKGLGVHGKGLVIGQRAYNEMREFGKQEPLELKEGEAFFHHNDRDYNGYKEKGEKFPVEEFTLSLGQVDRTFKKSGEKYGDFVSFMRIGYGNLFVVEDQVYEDFKSQAAKDEKVNYAMYKFENGKDSIEPGKEIESKYYESLNINAKGYTIEQMGKVYGTILFIGFFIALLFFIASGSVIYFKLFNEIESDRVEYEILRNIGMTKKDIKAIVTKQLRVLFFLPFIIGSIHSLVALKSLSNMLSINLIRNGLVVSLSYFIFQILFFIFIRRIYMKKLRIN